MPSLIKLNISNIDPKYIQDNKSIIQEEVLSDIADILKEDLGKTRVSQKEPIYKSRVHNTIFINGIRGSGKTQLLLSIKKYIKKVAKDSKDLDKLYFYDPIDPTLLHDNENFLTIIIAKILNDLEEKRYLFDYDNNKLYKLINDLSDAIDGIINGRYQTKNSLENISQDQTSLKLEEYLHKFFGLVAKDILKKERLILLIDDVDMAFEKGFEVLEVVRKYLSSPFVIPVITGDLELYRTIVENNFTKKIDNSIKSEYIPKINQISNDYLLKVLPGHRRVYIKSLFDISEDKLILFVVSKKKIYYIDKLNLIEEYKEKNKDIEYTDFIDTIKNDWIQQKLAKKILDSILSNPIRGVIQFLHKEYSNNSYKFSMNDTAILKDKYNLELNITNWVEFYLGGLEYYTNKEYQKAIKTIKKGLKIVNRGELYFALGNIYKDIQEFEEAIEYYNHSIDLGYNIAESLYKIGEIFYLQKDYPNAKEYYEKSIKNNCKECNIYNRLGACYVLIGEDGKKALDNFDKAIECNPNDYRAYINEIEVSFIINRPLPEEFIEIFKNKFSNNKKALKVYEMLSILKDIINIKDKEEHTVIETKIDNWIEKYKDTNYKEWNFVAMDKYEINIKNTETRRIFKEALSKFKDNM